MTVLTKLKPECIARLNYHLPANQKLEHRVLHDSPTASPFTSFPCVTGHEIVGIITKAGAGVAGFKPGNMVTINPGLGCEAQGISPVCPSCRAGRASCENFAKGKHRAMKAVMAFNN